MNKYGAFSHRGAKGHTVIELAVAMTVLAAGSAILWYGIRSAARMDKVNRLHHTALWAARSDMETVRLLPKRNIHDTAFTFSGPGGEPLRLVRQVFDSTRIMSTLKDIVLDEKLSPVELRKPLEVQVRVLLNPEGSRTDIGLFTGSDQPETGDGEGRALVTLILKLPEYRWY